MPRPRAYASGTQLFPRLPLKIHLSTARLYDPAAGVDLFPKGCCCRFYLNQENAFPLLQPKDR